MKRHYCYLAGMLPRLNCNILLNAVCFIIGAIEKAQVLITAYFLAKGPACLSLNLM